MHHSLRNRGEKGQEMGSLHAAGAAGVGIDPEHEVRRDLGELNGFAVAVGVAGGTDSQASSFIVH